MNDSELIELFKRCGSLGRSNNVGRSGQERREIDISECTRNVSDSFPFNVQMNNPQAHHVWP